MRRTRWLGAVVAAGVVLVLVAGTLALLFRPPAPTGTPSQLPPLSEVEPRPDEPASDESFARFYAQEPTWTACYEAAQCATVSVPVDWAAPEGEILDLAVVRLRATNDDRIGSLVINPGGPGASGVQYVGRFGRQVTSEALRERYDVVGFDPRGVGQSRPVDCLPDAEMDAYLARDSDPSTAQGLAEMTAEARRFAQGCAASAGPLLAHVDTRSAALDMDVLRAALDDERLNYLGKSYGTLLGATYADALPHRVGRMVLDGALDPASGNTDVVVGQAAGLERALRAFVQDCLDRRECPLSGDVDDGVDQVRTLLRRVDAEPLPTGDAARPLTEPLAVTGVVAPLYSQDSWPQLGAALADAFDGDGRALLAAADSYADRRPDGRYDSNLLEAFPAVNCLDYPVDDDPVSMREVERLTTQASPTFGRYLAYGEVLCGQWPVRPVRTPAPVRASGAPPVLVVGTTGDPATPYEWARSLAEQLESGRLLTWEGEGHTAYGRGSACVDGAVDRLLLDGELPGEGATCSQ